MNAVFLSVIVEKTGYERWQTESKLKILTKVLQFMLVAIFFFSFFFFFPFFFFFTNFANNLRTSDAPYPFSEERGRLYTVYDW